MAHTSSAADVGMASPTIFTLVTRQMPATFTYQKLPEVCGPFGLNRSPSCQFMQRLKDFPPSMQDIIIVASTSSEDVGLFTRSKTPLTSNVPADSITNVFTTTSMATDSRRAQIPMTEDMSSNTSVIGMAMDFSSKTKVTRPLPAEEMDESSTPLPALMILNNEGVLMSWWVVYADSIRQGTAYPGLIVNVGTPQSQPQLISQAQPIANTIQQAAPAFGQSNFGQNGFHENASNMFGGSLSKPAAPAFGNAGGLGSQSSPWGTLGASTQPGGATAFGKPSFGNATPFGSTAPGAAFGASGGLGNRASPWGTSSIATPTAPSAVFGQAGGLGAGPAFGATTSGGVFGAPSSNPNAGVGNVGSGFASFAQGSGFASASAAHGSGESVFGKSTPAASFGSVMDIGSSFGGPSNKSGDKPNGLFGSGDGFVLKSAWKNDAATKEDSNKPGGSESTSLFDGSFGKALGETAAGPGTPQIKESDMMSDHSDDNGRPSSPNAAPPRETTTPADTPASVKFFSNSPATGSLFGTQSQNKATPAATKSVIPATNTTSPNSFAAAVAASDPFASAAVKGGLFGTKHQDTETPATPRGSTPPISTFGMPNPAIVATTPKSPKIKLEPVDTPFGISKSLPQAPLPPNPTSKTSYTPSNSSPSSTAASKASGEDAPLPPDFIVPKNKKPAAPLDDLPLPPDFSHSTSKPSAAADADDEEIAPPPDDLPLSPEFSHSTSEPKAAADADDEEVAPPPDDLPLSPEFSHLTSGPSAAADADVEEIDLPSKEDDSLGEEDSGVDVAQDISPKSDTDQSLKVTPESSFGVQVDKSPIGGLFTKITRPQPHTAHPLFGEIGKPSATFFPPPTQSHSSPRSPSPIRSVIPRNMLRPDVSRSVSAPGIPPQGDLNRKATLGRPMRKKPLQQTSILGEEDSMEKLDRLKKQRAQQQAEEEQDLSDREDEKVREELETEVEPTTTLEPFIAHQDYVGNINKSGVSGQIERVYRDINSMVDTLGLNARSLQAFTKGHSELNQDGGRTREDLESDSDWCLIEIADLAAVENSIESDLDSGRLHDVQDKIADCRSLQKELAKTRSKNSDIKRIVDTIGDAEHAEALRAAPLSAEQSALRNDLRKDLTDFQKLLAEAEENVSILRAKLVSHDIGKKKGLGQKVPTVEAVERTITKMTGMVEKKSGDIDLLETQMRKLNVIGRNATSREGSPFATPPTSTKKNQALARTPASASSVNSNAAFFTPRSGFGGSTIGGANGSPRRRMSQVTAEDVDKYGSKARSRKETNGLLKEALRNREFRIRSLNDV